MLENILQMVREYGQQQVVDNPEIPNENNEAVMAEASNAVAGTLQQQAAAGNTSGIMDLFKSGDHEEIMRNPLAQNMQSGFLDNITSKLGINKNAATGLAATFIPMILSKLVHRTNSKDPSDSGFDLGSLLSGFTGGGDGHGFGNLLNQFTGNKQVSGIDENNTNQRISAADSDKSGTGGLSTLINDFLKR